MCECVCVLYVCLYVCVQYVCVCVCGGVCMHVRVCVFVCLCVCMMNCTFISYLVKTDCNFILSWEVNMFSIINIKDMLLVCVHLENKLCYGLNEYE